MRYLPYWFYLCGSFFSSSPSRPLALDCRMRNMEGNRVGNTYMCSLQNPSNTRNQWLTLPLRLIKKDIKITHNGMATHPFAMTSFLSKSPFTKKGGFRGISLASALSSSSSAVEKKKNKHEDTDFTKESQLNYFLRDLRVFVLKKGMDLPLSGCAYPAHSVRNLN